MSEQPCSIWPAGVPRRLQLPERNVAENLAASAEAQPDRLALCYHGAEISYGELQRRVLALAGWLEREAGIRKGDRVLLYMQNSPQFVIGYYAILRANAAVVPVNPMNRRKELGHQVDDTGARVALVGQELLDHILPTLEAGRLRHIVVAAYADMAAPDTDIPLPAGLEAPGRDDYGTPGVVGWARMEQADLKPGPITAGPDDLAIIPYTSGTTGRQKGCMHTHRAVMTTLVGSVTWNPQGIGGASLTALPLFHVTGMQNSMNAPIYCADPMVIMSRWDRRVAARLIERYQITRWRSIATMAIDLLNDPELRKEELASLRTVGGGGAAMPAAVALRLRELTGLEYIEGYGMSETMAAVLINPVDQPRRQCLGIPIFDVDARIIDSVTDQELGPDQPGEIIVSCPQVFQGYWNDPAATAAAFLTLDGKRFLRTGDVGKYDKDGYFYVVDRLKRMVNASGFKVWPTEVEALMHEHPQVVEVCIVGYPDPRRGESVLAYVVARGGLTEEALVSWCREQMAAYKVPRRIVFLDELPRSAAGKIRWMELQNDASRDFGTPISEAG